MGAELERKAERDGEGLHLLQGWTRFGYDWKQRAMKNHRFLGLDVGGGVSGKGGVSGCLHKGDKKEEELRSRNSRSR